MKFKAVRALTKNGNSYTVALPRQFIIGLGLMRREQLLLVYDDDTEQLTITRATPRADRPKRESAAHAVRPLL